MQDRDRVSTQSHPRGKALAAEHATAEQPGKIKGITREQEGLRVETGQA